MEERDGETSALWIMSMRELRDQVGSKAHTQVLRLKTGYLRKGGARNSPNLRAVGVVVVLYYKINHPPNAISCDS